MASLRPAAAPDIPVLVKHRRWMFEDMSEAQGLALTSEGLDLMEGGYADYLHAGLADGCVRGWVAVEDDKVVASGAISMHSWPPGPGGPACDAGLMHSVYTAPEYRLRGFARQVVEQAIRFCREQGLRSVTIGGPGAEAARHLYESMGFKQSINSQLDLA